MARSLKKGPFADASLLKKVDAMNAAGDKAGYQDLVSSFYNLPTVWLDIQLPFMTEENMFRYM